MEWLQRMSDGIDYLEQHMESKLNVDELGRAALSSKFHFQRMFHMLTGVTVAEYVRKRRLTLAAQELATSDVKVIDVAFKYGYQTPESFTKAFRKLHGINPSEVRSSGISLKAYPRLSFQIQLKGVKDMNYRIVDKEAFKIIGKGIRVRTENGENFKRIPQFWDECHQSGACLSLAKMAGELGLLGVCTEFDSEQEELTYMIAAEKGKDMEAGEWTEKEIPAATWAIFESIGPMPGAIQEVWQRIFSEWFPATGYEHAGIAELEVYPEGNPQDENYRSQIWIPIIKK